MAWCPPFRSTFSCAVAKGFAQHSSYEWPLGVGVAPPVVGQRHRQIALQRLILARDRRVVAEIVAKRQVIAPQRARPTHEMDVMAARVAATKILASGQARRP